MGESRADFLKRRKQGIGGSDVAAIFGESRFKSAYDVWLEKTTNVPEQPPTPAMARGIALESIAIEQYAGKTGATITKAGHVKPSGHYGIVANPDFLAEYPDETGALIEVKVTSFPMFMKIKEQGWKAVPREWYWQCYHYAAMSHALGGNEAAWASTRFGWDDGRPPLSFPVKLVVFNAEVWDCIELDLEPVTVGQSIAFHERIQVWWNRHILGNAVPDQPSPEVHLPEDLPEQLPEMIEQLFWIRKQKAHLEAMESNVRAGILHLMDTGGIEKASVCFDENRRYDLTVKHQSREGGVDLNRLRMDYPQAYDAVKKPSTTFRVVGVSRKGAPGKAPDAELETEIEL